MLEYVKLILDKVSFDSGLFEKELHKNIRLLLHTELELLRDWCYTRFADAYHPILDRVFGYILVA
jgi:hypothetical protein